MSKISERIVEVINAVCAGKNERFARVIGISEGSVRSYRSGGEPKSGTLAIICEKFNVSPAWILLGQGSMFGLSEEEMTKLKTDIENGTDPSELESLEFVNKVLVEQNKMLLDQNIKLQEKLMKLV